LPVFFCGFVFKNSHVTLMPELVVYKKNKQTKTNSSVCKWRFNRMAYSLSLLSSVSLSIRFSFTIR
jgi:hypothetical protein